MHSYSAKGVHRDFSKHGYDRSPADAHKAGSPETSNQYLPADHAGHSPVGFRPCGRMRSSSTSAVCACW